VEAAQAESEAAGADWAAAAAGALGLAAWVLMMGRFILIFIVILSFDISADESQSVNSRYNLQGVWLIPRC
jgi:hypothetical protein